MTDKDVICHLSSVICHLSSADGEASLDVRLEQETVWLNQARLVDLFERSQL